MAVQAVDKEYLTLHFSEFNTDAFPESRINSLNETAALFLAESVLGIRTRYARMLYIAHTLKVSVNDGAGAVTSRKVGDLAESYAAPMSDESMKLTAYGRKLYDLIKQFGKGDVIFHGC
jgi:Protein of unknown function (DUF4054)